MASNNTAATAASPPASTGAQATSDAPIDDSNTHPDSTATSQLKPVEMTNLESKPRSSLEVSQSTPATTSADNPTLPTPSDNFQKGGVSTNPAAVAQVTSTDDSSARPLDGQYSTAIGPSSDQPSPAPKDVEAAGPTLMITLLLTTGARHPFKIDSKYLNKRGIKILGNDPFNMSVYDLKEMILREWREEWEAKPQNASAIRLISFGKLLDDKAPLKESKFNHDAPNVVHMTVKPQDFIDDEEAAKTKGVREQGTESSPGCRCVIL